VCPAAAKGAPDIHSSQLQTTNHLSGAFETAHQLPANPGTLALSR
jgi:hypothetical protein